MEPDFQQQVLMALLDASRMVTAAWNGYIAERGCQLFGDGWLEGGRFYPGDSSRYYPQLSLALGKLGVRGLAERHEGGGRPGRRFGLWMPSQAGQQAGRELLAACQL